MNTKDQTLSLSVGKFIGLAELIGLYADDLTGYEVRELRLSLRNLDSALGLPGQADRRNGDRRSGDRSPEAVSGR